MKYILLCLHGWGGSQKSFDPLRKALLLAKNLQILTPDLPGFGSEPEPTKPFSINDYVVWIEEWLEKTGHLQQNTQTKLLLLGHSHGGRIAIRLAQKRSNEIHHLYLCAAAGIRHSRHIKRIIGLILAKGGKYIFAISGLRSLQPWAKKMLYKLVRVHDYEKASDIMRRTLLLVTKENLREELKNIKTPTDIFWGENDRMTPLSDAFIMKNDIQKSVLHTFKNVRHNVHRECAENIAQTILSQTK